MPIVVHCPSCSRRLRVPDELLGTRVKCPTCDALFNAVGPPPAPDPTPTSGEASLSSTGSPAASPELVPAPVAATGLQLKLSLDEDGPPAVPVEQKPLPPPETSS